MKAYQNSEVWFVTGSQHLYGPEVLDRVTADSQVIAKALDGSPEISVKIVFKTVLTSAGSITALIHQANASTACIGLITWCHTFSPSKMWIHGLKILQKPLLHLHTQLNRDLPWGEIDMDFMNLNQSAHGDREHGYIMSRLRLNRKVVVGHWQDPEVVRQIGVWVRAAAGWDEMLHMKVARFGDNMRGVAVTEGDKVTAQIRFGMSVDGYGLGDLVREIDNIAFGEVDRLVDEYENLYIFDDKCRKGEKHHVNVRYQARLEAGIRKFLDDGGYKAFTTTFEDLHGLEQLPGLAVQRLMAAGYGFGAEGDWKHAALVRVLKTMGEGLEGGCSFMEDYTYHLDPGGMAVLGAHMLEICPTIGNRNSRIEVHPLGIGGKADPARLVFNVQPGTAITASLVDLGDRFRMIANDVTCIAPKTELKRLPVARALWIPQPDLKTGAAAWIYAGGAHHTVFSQAVNAESLADFCEMADVEFLHIGAQTCLSRFKQELKWNDLFYHMGGGLKSI